MVRHTIRGLFQLVGVLTAGLLILVAAAAWRLSAGPISLSFLTPYFEGALNSDNSHYLVHFEDTILAWSKERSILEIRVRGVHVAAREGGVVAEIPEMSVSLSGRALFRGEITPRRLAVYRPQLVVIRRPDGSFEFGNPDDPTGAGTFASRILAEMTATDPTARAFRDLNQFSIVDGDLTIDDRRLNTTWRAPVTDITLTRNRRDLIFEATVDVQTKSRYATITLDGQYALDGSDLHFDAEFVNVNPRVFAEISPDLKVLETVNAPLTGSVSVAMGQQGQISTADFHITAGQGSARIESPMPLQLDFMSADARGRYDARSQVVEISDLMVELGKDGALKVPEPVDHAFPVRKIRVSATYDGRTRTIEVPRLSFDLDGPSAAFSLAARFSDDGAEIAANGLAENLPITGIARYWPPKIAVPAHNWVVTHMTGGGIPEVKFKVGARWTRAKGFDLTELSGTMKVRDTNIDYLPPMPQARHVSANAKFDGKTFDFNVTSGEAEGIKVQGGRVLFTGLDQYDQYADIDMHLVGPFAEAMAMVDHEPLGFAAAVGIKPSTVRGEAAVDLKLHFLTERDMTVDRVKIAADADLTEIHVPDLVLGLDLSFGRMHLSANNQGMDVTGTAWLGTMAIDLAWRENFTAGAGPARTYRVTTQIDDIQRISELGFDTPPFTREFMTGPADAVLDIVYDHDGNGRLDADFQLGEMALALPEFDWSKPAGVDGKAHVTLALKGTRMTGVERLNIEAGDLVVDARADFDQAGNLKDMTFKRLAFGLSDLAGRVERTDGEWHADVHGSSVDLIKWLEETGKDSEDNDEDKLPPVTITAKLDHVYLAPERTLNAFHGKLAYDGKKWRSIDVDAAVGEGKKVRIVVTSTNGTRHLAVTSEDAGATLRALNFYDNLVGGTLKMTGTFDDSKPDAPLTGHAVIDKYRVVNAPALVHLLSIAALTGIVEALSGDGLAFDILDAPFVYENGVAKVTDGRASGPSLGVTASGILDTNNVAVDVSGTIVPAYAVNSAFGKLPVIGELLTGGEKGGGVFAANYSLRGKLDDPKVTINPLSILTPGFLRKIFGILPGVEPTARQSEPSEPPKTN